MELGSLHGVGVVSSCHSPVDVLPDFVPEEPVVPSSSSSSSTSSLNFPPKPASSRVSDSSDSAASASGDHLKRKRRCHYRKKRNSRPVSTASSVGEDVIVPSSPSASYCQEWIFNKTEEQEDPVELPVALPEICINDPVVLKKKKSASSWSDFWQNLLKRNPQNPQKKNLKENDELSSIIETDQSETSSSFPNSIPLSHSSGTLTNACSTNLEVTGWCYIRPS